MMGPRGGSSVGSQQWSGAPSTRQHWGREASVTADPAINNYDDSIGQRFDILIRILSELNNAIVPREVRLSAIMTSIEEFTHDDQARHDCELDANADRILFQKLAFALSIDKSSDEVGLICTALELVYGGSRTRVAAAFNEFGMTALPFIMMMIEGVPRRVEESIQAKVDTNKPNESLKEVRNRAQMSDRGFSNHQNVYNEKGDDYMSLPTNQSKGGSKSAEKSMDTIDCSKSINTDSMFSLDSFDNLKSSKGATKSSSQTRSGAESRAHETHNTDETFKTEDMDDLRDINDDVTRNTNHTEDMQSINTDEVFSDPQSKQNKGNSSSKGSTNFVDDVSEITGLDNSRPDVVRSSVSMRSVPEKSIDPMTEASVSESKELQSIVTGVTNFSDFGMSAEEFSKTEFQNEKISKDIAFDVSQKDVENLLSDFNKGISDDFSKDIYQCTDFFDDKEDPPNQLGVLKMLKVLRYFSRVLSAMVPLAHHPGLIDSLLYQLEQLSGEGLLQLLQDLTTIAEFGGSDNGKSIMTAARIDTIAVMVNLACAEENKVMMVDHPGLLDTVINVARNDPSDEAREHSAIVLMNLAYSTHNKEVMAEHDQLLSTLTMLMSDTSPYTRKYAASALFALASVVSKTALLTTYCGKEILEALRQVLLHDPSEEARVNASEALVNMARSTSNETALKLSSHPYLLDAMAEAVISDYSADVRAYCARGLEILANIVHYPEDCHKELIRALIKASQWTKTMSIGEALKVQASTPSNQIVLVSYPGLLEALASLATLGHAADQYVRSCALAAIERLTVSPQNRPFIARNKDIMEALTLETFRTRKYGVDETNPNSIGFLMREALKNLANTM